VKSTGLLIATVLLLLLTGVIWWSNKKEAGGAKPEANLPPKLLSFDQSAITSFTIRHKNQGPLTLAKDNDSWRIMAPTPLAAR